MAPALADAAKAYFDAFNSHDAIVVTRFFAEDGELRDWNIHAKGKHAVKEAVAGIFVSLPDINCKIIQMHEDSLTNTVVAELQIDLGDAQSILVADVFAFTSDLKILALRAYKG